MFIKTTGTAVAIALLLGGAASAHGLDVNVGTSGPAYHSTLDNQGANVDRTYTGSIGTAPQVNRADRGQANELGVSPRQSSAEDFGVSQ